MSTRLPFLLCLILILIRGWGRLTQPDLWAEDAAIFFQQAYADGVPSLLTPYAGFFHTIPRLATLLTIGLFPAAWVPSVICFIAYILAAGAFSRFARVEYRWLLPSDLWRWLVCLSFCLAPGLNEMLGNLSNLSWILTFWMALILLQDISGRLTWRDCAFASLICLSTGSTVFLFPLLAWRLWAKRQRPLPELAMLAIAVGSLVTLMVLRESKSVVGLGQSIRAIHPLVTRFFLLSMLEPWLGDSWLLTVLRSPAKLTLGLIFAALFFLIAAVQFFRRAWFQALIALLGPVAFWPMVCWMARYDAFDYFLDLTSFNFLVRYAFPLGFMAILFWNVWLGQTLRKPVVGIGFFILLIYFSHYRFDVRSYGGERRWAKTQAALNSSIRTGCPSSVSVSAYPEGWGLRYVSAKPGQCGD